MPAKAAHPIHILLVEDRRDDVDLAIRALARAKLQNQVTCVSDGEAALTYLRTQRPLPDLVLLDLNLPRVSGRDVLVAVRRDPELRDIPIIVLTASSAEHAPIAAMAADAFMTKPVNFERLSEAVAALAGFGWALVKVAV